MSFHFMAAVTICSDFGDFVSKEFVNKGSRLHPIIEEFKVETYIKPCDTFEKVAMSQDEVSKVVNGFGSIASTVS